MMQQPVLSLLFPLYRSKPHLPNLLKNLEQIAHQDFEVIISDRHCEDDTIDVLEAKFNNNQHFRFIKATDRIGWVDHYNLLLQQAKGKYFSWVPHDDIYPSEYFAVLVEEMEQQPSSLLCFSTMRIEGNTWWAPDYTVFKKDFHYPFSSKQYLQLLDSGLLGIPFRGVFKRQPIVEKKLWIRQNRSVTAYQDLFWVFALLQHGGFIYTEKTFCTKNFIEGSAHSGWKKKMMSKRNPYVLQMIFGYLFDSPLPFTTKVKLGCGLLTPGSVRNRLKL